MNQWYRLFISHAWRYGEEYDRLVALLNGAQSFPWLNWSAPEDRPAIPPGMVVPNQVVIQQIAAKMRMADCVLVIAGMYAHYSDWIQAEMDIAQRIRLPLIGVRPWGSQRIPEAVVVRTAEDVGWQTESIVAAIKRHIAPR